MKKGAERCESRKGERVMDGVRWGIHYTPTRTGLSTTGVIKCGEAVASSSAHWQGKMVAEERSLGLRQPAGHTLRIKAKAK